MVFTWDFEKHNCLAQSLLQLARAKRPYNTPHGTKAERWTSFQAVLLRNNCFARDAPNLDTIKTRVNDMLLLSIEMDVSMM